MDYTRRLSDLGITLPTPATPIASYVPAIEANGLLHVSGQPPVRLDGKLITGQVGMDLDTDQGNAAARACGVMLPAQTVAALAGLNRIVQVVKLGAFVSSAADYIEQSKVANGASDLMQAVFGPAGQHARSAVGVAQLPLGVAVEVDAIFSLRTTS